MYFHLDTIFTFKKLSVLMRHGNNRTSFHCLNITYGQSFLIWYKIFLTLKIEKAKSFYPKKRHIQYQLVDIDLHSRWRS